VIGPGDKGIFRNDYYLPLAKLRNDYYLPLAKLRNDYYLPKDLLNM
jgi:hypothetical protein